MGCAGWAAKGGFVERPRVILSRCLELAACRYDGGGIRSGVVRMLTAHVELVPVCPEVQIGLGVPRAPIQIEDEEGSQRLMQPSTGRDLTDRMTAFSHSFADATPDVDGLLLKSRSPSCGVVDVKIFVGGAPGMTKGAGMFARVMMDRYPYAAIEDEARLEEPTVLRRWATRVWANARLRRAVEEGRAGLAGFHARYEPVRQLWPAPIRHVLDRIVEDGDGSTVFGDAAAAYRSLFARALAEVEDPESAVVGGGLEPFPRELLGPGS